MTILTAAAIAIALHCGGGVDPDLLAGFATVESANSPLVIHQNIHATPGRSFHPQTLSEAVQIASSLIAAGKSIDTGTFQINSKNLDLLEISLTDTFDTCASAAAAARLLALMSRYNSGSPTAAMAYAKRVTAAVHAVKAGAPTASLDVQAGPLPSPPCAPAWDAWALAACGNVPAPSPLLTVGASAVVPRESN